MGKPIWALGRSARFLAAMSLVFLSTRMAPGPLKTPLWITGSVWQCLELFVAVRTGYLRQKPHWPAESRRAWSRTLIVRGALLAVVLVICGIPLTVGDPGTRTRMAFALLCVVLMFVSTWWFCSAAYLPVFRLPNRPSAPAASEPERAGDSRHR